MSYALGAAPSVAAVQTKLIELAAQARAATDALVASTSDGLFTTWWQMAGRITMKEWAQTFKAQVDDMVGRLISFQSDGQMLAMKKPELVLVVSEYIKEAIREQGANWAAAPKNNLQAVSQGFGIVAAWLGQQAGVAGREALNAFLKALKDQPPGDSMVTVAVAGGVVLVLAAYVWRAFK
jgi:hypothetical protein